jgi:hypothetical protein
MKDIEISIITFKHDIPNTYMQFLSLGKNLSSKTKIVVYYNYENKNTEEKEINLVQLYIKKFLSQHDVTFLLKPTAINNSQGWISQQLIKWYSAYCSKVKYQVVLDSKNFLLKPFSLDDISIDHPPAFGKDITDEWTKETLDHCKQLIFEKTGTNRQGSSIDAITPWIWDTKKVKEMLDTLWPNMSWCEIHHDNFLVSEWLLYITWIEDSINYDTQGHLTTGLWGAGISNNDSIELAKLFRNVHNIKFWTHHRIQNNPIHYKVTRRLLKEYNVCSKSEYNHWIELRTEY